MDDDAFVSQLRFEDNRREYPRSIRRQIREVRAAVWKDYGDFEKTHEEGIRTERDHDIVVNLCVYPFVVPELPPARLGYRFLRGAPLDELGGRNFDFLIFRREGKKPIAIFGEAKSSIVNFGSVVNEVAEKQKIVESKLDYIKSEYLKSNVDPICEYVLAVRTSFGTKTRDAIEQSGKPMILWTVDYLKHRELRLEQTPRGEPMRHLMAHNDEALTKVLAQGTPSDSATFAFYPQSHIVSKLKTILAVKEESEYALVAKFHKLRTYLGIQLSYLNDSQREAEFQAIITEAEKMGFVTVSKKTGELNLQSRYRKMKTLEEELEKRWVRHKFEEESNAKVEAARLAIQSEFTAREAKLPPLF